MVKNIVFVNAINLNLAADLLAKVTERMTKLVKHMEKEYPE